MLTVLSAGIIYCPFLLFCLFLKILPPHLPLSFIFSFTSLVEDISKKVWGKWHVMTIPPLECLEWGYWVQWTLWGPHPL